jgi:YYY domain-containing protein
MKQELGLAANRGKQSENQGHAAPRERAALWPTLVLALILVAATGFRFAGLDWDEGAHLHPDERFLTQVETAIEPTFNLGQYFDTAHSELNPRNTGHGFFVYGSLPIFIVRYVAEGLETLCAPDCVFAYTGYDGVHLVGRALSALFDLGTVVLLYSIGRRLYSWRVGLLASALGALAVLPIQQAHFFTVDSFLTFFVTLAFYYAVRVAQGRHWRHWIFFGLALGMALACKISVWPLGLVLVGAATIRAARTREPLLGRLFWGLVAAAAIAFLTFRVCQPYAFVGLNYDPQLFRDAVVEASPWWSKAYDLLPGPIRALILPEPRWLQNMDYIQNLMGGVGVETPPNHQWTDRAPILFPLINIVLYGLGPALGLAAWAGSAVALGQMLSRRWREGAWQKHLLPVLWVTLFFLYQGTQWVKTMRYFYPLYPQLILLAAWLVVSAWGWIMDRAPSAGPGRRWRLGAAAGLVALVALPTFLWALAFTGIYRQPMTRVAASRWIYENVPTGATLLYETTEGPAELQIPLPSFVYSYDGAEIGARFEMPVDGTATGVRMNYLSDPGVDPEPELFRIALLLGSGSSTELASKARSLNLESAQSVRGDAYLFDFSPTPLSGGQTYYFTSKVMSGAPVRSTGALLINETSWDDGMPWRLDGRDGFSMYEGQLLELYWDDDESKLQRMVDLLNQGEYLFISSTRQLGSITRLPPRYPLTIAFYQALFDGELGYDLVQTFTGDIHIGPLVIDDVYAKVGWGEPPEVGWPPPGALAAEEAFSVYDHPPVWIFEKSPDYQPSEVRAVLESVDLSQRRFVIPYDYTRELRQERRPGWLQALLPGGDSASLAETPDPPKRSMYLAPEELAEQRTGGTWRELFDVDGLLTRHPAVGAAVWWISLLVLGWLAFPVASIVLGGLPSRGYLVSKVLALLVIAWISWLLPSLKLLPYTRGTIWLAIGVLALAGGVLAWKRRRTLVEFVRTHWRMLLLFEGVALGLYVISLLIRCGNPDLWHPTFGGEKPLDLAFLNAVLKSTTFPPYDPWLAGAYTNYYYFGYVIVGSLIKVLRIVPTTAYNIALPMLFSLTGIGAFSVGFDLVEGLRRRKVGKAEAGDAAESPPANGWARTSLYAGLAAAAVAVLLGNLGQIAFILGAWNRLGGDQGGWIVETARGFWRYLGGQPLPVYLGSWYWDATRIIPPAAGEAGPISEFPFFTYLYADLHAHMIDMPLVLLALAWALGLARRADRDAEGVAWRWSTVGTWIATGLVGALVIGALRATNTWDWPTMLGVAAVAIIYSAWRLFGGGWRWVAAAGGAILIVGGVGQLAFLPYTRNFVPAYTEVMRWEGGTTPIWAYVAVHGLFLFVLVTNLIREFIDWRQHLTDERLEALEPWAGLIGLAIGVFLAAMASMLLLGVPVGPVVLLLLVPSGLLALQRRLPVERRAVLALLALGLALTLGVELIVLSGDISRMNTVFKFYMQVWLLLSAVAGAALVWTWEWIRHWRPVPKRIWRGAFAFLVLLAALYPPTAARAKIEDRFHADQPPAGLDGMAYMLTSTYYDQDQAIPLESDYAIIRWLQDHVAGSPVIIEMNTFPKIYGWGNRISIYTGLPSVVGWEWHTRQHRAGFPGATEEVRKRVQDVIEFYNTGDVDYAMQILRTYDVEYVIVGRLEQAYSNEMGLVKFADMVDMGLLEMVYQTDGGAIYRVR